MSASVSLIDSCTARGAQLCKCLCFLHSSPRCWGSLCQQPPRAAGGAVSPEFSSSSMWLWAARDIPEGRSPISTREVSLWPLTKEASRVCLVGKGRAALHHLSIPRCLVGDGISRGSDECPPFFLPFRMNKRSFLGTWVALLAMTVRHQG